MSPHIGSQRNWVNDLTKSTKTDLLVWALQLGGKFVILNQNKSEFHKQGEMKSTNIQLQLKFTEKYEFFHGINEHLRFHCMRTLQHWMCGRPEHDLENDIADYDACI